MCTTCGCGPGEVTVEGHAHDHDHDHEHGAHGDLHYGHGAAHSHAPGMSQEKMVAVERG